MALLRNPHLLLMLTAIFWSGNAIAGKFAVGHVSPMMLTLARWALALAIMVTIAQEPLRRDWSVIRKHWIYLLLMGGFGYTAFNFFLYSAVKYTSAINVTLEQSAMPLVIFIVNYLIYRTGITGLQVLGFVVTTLGVLVTVSSGDPYGLLFADGETAGLNRGDFYMLGAAICYGGYSAALRSKPEMNWMSFLTCLIAGAFVFAIGGAAMEYQAGQLQFPMTLQGVLVILYAGIFPSLLSQGFFIRGVEAFGANIAGLYINLVPVFGAILAVVLLGEQLFLFHALAFVLVIGGIMIAQHTPAAARSKSKS